MYTNFLSRGKDVVFVKDTPLEIGFSEPHAKAPEKTLSHCPFHSRVDSCKLGQSHVGCWREATAYRTPGWHCA